MRTPRGSFLYISSSIVSGKETFETNVAGYAVRQAHLKSQKNDLNDAEAICGGVSRPNMRFVPSKSIEQQVLTSVTPNTQPDDRFLNAVGEIKFVACFMEGVLSGDDFVSSGIKGTILTRPEHT